jgi:CheY-like chemotaxis protein
MGSQYPQRRILIIDDNVDAAYLIAQLLEMHGFITATASGGTEGIDLAHSFRPEVVMLDLGMPIMNGYEVAALLRSQTALGKFVLVAYTAWGDEETKAKTAAAGFDYHVTKPISLEVLLETAMLT